MAQKTTGAAKGSSDLDSIPGIRRFNDAFDYDGEVIPTGILELDKALGGGLPRGKIVEVFGPEASGKSAISIMTAGQAQNYGTVVYIDIENTLDPRILSNSGVDMDELRILQYDTAEKVFDALHKLAEMEDVSLVVVDSVAALVPEAELAGDMSDGHMAVLPRVMSQGLKRLNARTLVNPKAPTFVLVNQIRDKMGGMGGGSSTQSTGGRALRFYSSIRMDARYVGKYPAGAENVLGFNVKVNVVKNKYHASYRVANFKILYETGVANEATVIEESVKTGYLLKSGSWYKFPGEDKNVANGEPAMIKWLRDNPDRYEELLGKVKENL